ncbi:hypothetical protein MACJ_001844 [Theileria orientalis]|uniref:Uncharacterized protein n=1 Tax=Theileria orientalis TaxID=68886 RepID=A0A976M6H8_THEOR|nr:hypothetical protein MACJ_001844 [Theileria orientalis]
MSSNYGILIVLALISFGVVAGDRGARISLETPAQRPYASLYQANRMQIPIPVKRRKIERLQSSRPPIATGPYRNERDLDLPRARPIRASPRDFDDIIDGSNDDDFDLDEDDDDNIKCAVEATRPYSTSPKLTITGLNERFNSLLIGYDIHSEGRRANKPSLYGWSSPKLPSESGVTKFNFDLDYVSIMPQGGTPLSYCALVFVPPLVPNFDMRSVFGKPAMSVERYFGSEEHLVKAVKNKSRKVTSCCFIAYPMVSRR